MTHEFKHPKYYTELRKRNKSDQAISSDNAPNMDRAHDGERERAPGPGPKPQATSYKLPGPRPISNANKGLLHKPQAPSESSNKPQASSPKQQASSPKPQASSSKIL